MKLEICKTYKTIGIVPTPNCNVTSLYDKLSVHFNVFILQPCDTVCPFKILKFDFYIFLQPTCKFHSITNSIQLLPDTNDIEIILTDEKPKEMEIYSPKLFTDTFYNFESYNTKINDKSIFLISRMSRMEKIKNKKVFGIYFTNKIYKKQADDLQAFLSSKSINSYLIFLEDICYERLTCIDNIEVYVVLDCMSRFLFDLSEIVVVTLYEVWVAFFESRWNGEYMPYNFEFVEEKEVNATTDIMLIENRINNISIDNRMTAVSYETVEPVNEIMKGKVGIASVYENEIE